MSLCFVESLWILFCILSLDLSNKKFNIIWVKLHKCCKWMKESERKNPGVKCNYYFESLFLSCELWRRALKHFVISYCTKVNDYLQILSHNSTVLKYSLARLTFIFIRSSSAYLNFCSLMKCKSKLFLHSVKVQFKVTNVSLSY